MGLPKERLFIPTVYEMIYLSLIGAGLLSMQVAISAWKDYDLHNYNFFSTTGKTFVDKQLDIFDNPHWATILTFALWMFCGILAYLVIWFIATVLKAYNDDSMPLHGFLTPRGYNLDAEAFSFVTRALIRFAAFILFFLWLILLLRSIMPYLSHVFLVGVSPFTFRSIPTMLVTSVMLGGCLFIVIVLARLILLRRRLFSSNITD